VRLIAWTQTIAASLRGLVSWYDFALEIVPEQTDAAFVAELMALGHSQPLPGEDFLSDVVRRLRARMAGWHWVGIYFLVGDTLVLGPYVGEPTEHVRIPIGIGVCGTAVAQNANIIVDDVRSQENYLACSIGTRSELVVLIRDGGEVVGQFDIDSDNVGAFSRHDEALLERLAGLVSSHCRSARDRLALQTAGIVPQVAPG
jgi:GAF domain-containing protein